MNKSITIVVDRQDIAGGFGSSSDPVLRALRRAFPFATGIEVGHSKITGWFEGESGYRRRRVIADTPASVWYFLQDGYAGKPVEPISFLVDDPTGCQTTSSVLRP